MALLVHFLFGFLALAGLLLGAELIISSAKRIAKRLGLSEFFVGLTLLSVLTSLPEIMQHIVASIDIIKGVASRALLSGIVVGTNIGSNIIQITLITGIVGLFGTLKCRDRFLRKDYFLMLLSILLLFFFSLTDSFINQLEGIILFALYMFYLAALSKEENFSYKVSHDISKSRTLFDFLLMAVGFVAMYFGADHILKEAVYFSETYHLSGSLIGSLIIGVATALPELTTAVTALLKKSSGLSLGTLVGSNITNPTMALGLGAMISGYYISPQILWFDLPYWFIISFIGFFLFWKGKYLSKPQAVVLVVGYTAYVLLRLKLFL